MIVPVLVRPDTLSDMVATIDHPVEHLIVIDNGCVVPEDFDAGWWVKRCSVIRMPANLGVAGSWNLGIKASPFSPWWLIANYDLLWPAGALQRMCQQGNRDSVVLSAALPPWCAFMLGDRVVAQVGLFDEAIHPGYFEDADYERRCRLAGVPVVPSGVVVTHDNSSTLREGFQQRNATTFTANAAYYRQKEKSSDVTEGLWSLTRRRMLSWD